MAQNLGEQMKIMLPAFKQINQLPENERSNEADRIMREAVDRYNLEPHEWTCEYKDYSDDEGVTGKTFDFEPRYGGATLN